MGQLIATNEGSTPSAPTSGKWTLFFKTEGLFVEDSSGNVYGPLQVVARSINLFLENTASGIGSYRSLISTVPTGGSANDDASLTAADTIIKEYLAPAAIFTFLPAQVSPVHLHLRQITGTKTSIVYVKLYHRTVGGVETLLGTSANSPTISTSETEYVFDVSIPDTVFAATDRFLLKVFGTPVGGGTAPTVRIYYQYTTNARVGLSGTASSGSSNPFDDGTAIIKGSADATKLLRFEVDGFTTATTRILTPQNRDGTLQVSDGWIDGLALGAWAYVSNSAPYGTFNINADVTGIIGIGDRIKFTQTTVKYFVVTAVGAYSGGFTAITIYGFSAIANAAITAPFYSHEHAPFGLPYGLDKPQVDISETTGATPATNTDSYNAKYMSACATAITSMTTNLTGTPTALQEFTWEFLDNGTARAITWGASFASGPATLPTTTVVNKLLFVKCYWSATRSKWICMAAGSEA